MASTTTNLGLHKIDLTDAPPDITVLNPNWDYIDEHMVDKNGGVMNGNLIIHTDSPTVQLVDAQVEGNQAYSEIRKNASADVDYGTYISDASGGTKDMLVLARANELDQKLLLRVESEDGASNTKYKIYGTHNTHAEIRQYADLADIGLTVGTETIEAIATTLPTYSRLIVTVGATNNAEIYPNSNYGLLVVDKSTNTRIVFTFTNNAGTQWIGVYAINSSGNTWTGWKMQYGENYISYGTADLTAGTTVLMDGKIHLVYE